MNYLEKHCSQYLSELSIVVSYLSELTRFSEICLLLVILYKFMNTFYMSIGPAHMGEIREKFSGTRVRWDADYLCKLDQVGCLTQVCWNPPFHACADMLGARTTYDLLTGNGRQPNLDVKHKMSRWK